MAQGNEIVLTEMGRRMEGIISGALAPGTIVQISNTATVNGRHTFEVYAPGTDGNQRPIFVLDIDHEQGKIATDAYTDGARCFVYAPAMGDELNVLWSAAGTGTGDAVAIGDLGIVDTGTGYLVTTTGSPESEPFQALEAVSDVVSTGTLVHVVYTGY